MLSAFTDPNTPSDLPDIHSVREAMNSKRVSPAEFFSATRAAAQSPACRHAFMPSSGGPQPDVLSPARSDQPLAEIPVSIKDLFDVAGQVTAAGSTVLATGPVAVSDSAAVARLRAAGAVLAGRTNMVEFAFSGVGINPHYGTPVNPADPLVERIPGGSSSGAAVSVATGAALAALGSDTGGSLRIPAALCGIVGFKSTARLVSTAGAIPLSRTLDTIGALTLSVRDAMTLHEVLAGRTVQLAGKPLSARRLAVCKTLMQDDLDTEVASAFAGAIAALERAGARIEEIALDDINDLTAINASGGLSAAESYAWHRHLLADHQPDYDPRVALRILRGASMSAADYIDLLAARQAWISRMQARMAGIDAILSPTVPMVAPPIAGVLHDDAEFFRVNGLLLRNTSVVNMLDGCAISIPCHPRGALPVGLMIWHAALHDDAVLDVAMQSEAALQSVRG